MLIIDGVGGAKMKPYMKNQFYSLKDFKSIGIIEILISINKYLKIISSLSKYASKHKYDLIITIDSPDFNYPLSKKIRKYQHDSQNNSFCCTNSFGHGEQVEQKNSQKFIMKYLRCSHLRINILKNIILNLPV